MPCAEAMEYGLQLYVAFRGKIYSSLHQFQSLSKGSK